jgi:hypothetical protein
MSELVNLLVDYRNGTVSGNNRSLMWLEVAKFVQKTARSHYKQPQSRGFRYKAGGVQNVSSNPLAGKVVDDDKYEKYMCRMTRFFDFLNAYPDKPIKWVLYVWRRRYALIEQVIDAERLGIGIYPYDMPFHKRVTHNVTKKLVECRTLSRKLGLLPTDFMKLEVPLNEIHTKKYTMECLLIYGGYVKASYPWLFSEEFTGDDASDSDS